MKNEAQHIESDTRSLHNFVRSDLSGHKWIQKGPYLICKSCDVEHGVYIGPDKMLSGYTEDGEPIIRPFEVSD